MSEFQKQNRSADSIAFLFGILAIFGIGVWWIFQHYRSNDTNTTTNTAEEMPADTFNRISTSDLKKIVLGNDEKSRNTVIFDMRTASAWNEEHIIGSESILLEEAKTRFHPSVEDQNRTWIIVAENIESAVRLATLIESRDIPHDHIFILDGNNTTWKNATGLVVDRGDPTSPVDLSKVRLVSLEEAKAEIDAGGQWFIIDARDAENYAIGHIPEAHNIPFIEIERRRHEISSMANILVYGKSDHESFSTGTLLFDLGFFNVRTLSAGFDDWKNKKFPIEK